MQIPGYTRCRIELSGAEDPIDFTELDASEIVNLVPMVPFFNKDGMNGKAVVLDCGGDEQSFWMELDISDVALATKEDQ